MLMQEAEQDAAAVLASQPMQGTEEAVPSASLGSSRPSLHTPGEAQAAGLGKRKRQASHKMSQLLEESKVCDCWIMIASSTAAFKW